MFVPPTRYWEQRDGATFGYRTGLMAHEEYWPGIFLHMERVQKEIVALLPGDPWKGKDRSGRKLRR